jgi:polysaccharide pyruvyl transferase WcaK-like protein
LIGVSVGPLYHQESKEAICNAFKFANAISVRDALSKELLCECGLDAERISIIPDLVYTLESAPKKIIDAILLQENMRTNNKSVAMTPCYYNESTPGWTEQYARMCSRILEETSLDIWLVPMQRGKGHDDHTAATNIFNSLSPALQARVKVLQGLYSATEIQGIIQQADYVIAERLHGSIMAINTRRPLRAIAYKPKVTGVLAHAKLSKNIITMDEFLSNALPQNVFELFNEAPDQSGMNDIRHEANQNLSKGYLIKSVLLIYRRTSRSLASHERR